MTTDTEQRIERLTASRLTCLRRCSYEHWLRYELRLSRVAEQSALRMGSAYHLGHELRNKGMRDEQVMQRIVDDYDPDEALELEIVTLLLAGHWWYYAEDEMIEEALAVEESFEVPLVNPSTGRASRTFTSAGKMDLVARLRDGRIAVLDYKTSSEDIGPDSVFWLRLRQDQQISQYFLAAQAMGYGVQTIVYDVVRKPSISPRQIPELDDDGCKIVVDEATGERVHNKDGSPRQSADTKRGWKLLTRTETVAEFGDRLWQDIQDRPEWYYQRREVPRLEDDLLQFQEDIWHEGLLLRTRQRAGWWTRTVNRWTCSGCQFSDLCLQSIEVNVDGDPPAGYQRLETPHPELDLD